MDAVTARLECLRIAAGSPCGAAMNSEAVLDAAKKWADFVVGPAPKESVRSGLPAGADDHLATGVPKQPLQFSSKQR